MENWFIATLLGGIIGVIMGYFIARKSATTKAIMGGPLAYVFHYVAAAAFSALAPTVFIAAVFFHVKVGQNLVIGLVLIAIAAISLLIFAFFESQHQPG